MFKQMAMFASSSFSHVFVFKVEEALSVNAGRGQWS
jgi:hypothetical protein